MNLEDLYRLLRSSHVQAQGVMDTIDEPLIVLDEHGCVLEANRAFFSTFLVERDDTIGAPFLGLGDGQWDIPELTKLISEIIPKAAAIVDYEITREFPHIGMHTFLLTARRLWKPDNNSTNILLVFSDVTATREKEREGSLLFSKMRHRLVNLLGVVRALANQTETEGRTAEEYKATFLGRFEALLRAQSLSGGGGSAILLADLISNVVGGLGGSRLHVSAGPPVVIDEKQVTPMTMILHELGTNALKYGAFSNRGGTVDLSWQIISSEASRNLHLFWKEKLLSPASLPERAGTGTAIIRKSAKLGLHGDAELSFKSDGFSMTLMMPLAGEDGRAKT